MKSYEQVVNNIMLITLLKISATRFLFVVYYDYI